MRGHRKYTLPSKLLEKVRQEIFPECCPGCNEILLAKEKEKGFCRTCAEKIIYIGDGGCVKCGKALTDLTQDLCRDCRKRGHAFVQNRAVYAYDGPMKEAMYRFKYSNCRAYRRIFAKDAWNIYGAWLRNLEVDAVVPVPMKKSCVKRVKLRFRNWASRQKRWAQTPLSASTSIMKPSAKTAAC